MPTRRRFLEQLFAAAVVTASAPSILLGRIVPVLRPSGSGLAGRYRIDLTQSSYAKLRTVGGSIKLASITGVSYRIIVTRIDESTFAAVNATCTHEGCIVNAATSTSNGLLVCPCHLSRFTATGEVNRGPATRPLERLETFFDGGDTVEIEIDGIAAIESDLAAAHVGEVFLDADGVASTDLVLERATEVRAAVHDTRGGIAATLVDARLDAGSHRLSVPTAELAPGAYLLRVETGDWSVIVRKFVVAR